MKHRKGKQKQPSSSLLALPSAESDEDTCAICLDVLFNTPEGHVMEPVAFLCDEDALQHVFHRMCADVWLSGKSPINQTCPICRQDPRAKAKLRAAQQSAVNRVRARQNSPLMFKLATAIKDVKVSWERMRIQLRPVIMPVLAVASLIIVIFIAAALLRHANQIVADEFGQQHRRPPPQKIIVTSVKVEEDNLPASPLKL